jgi:hypothetical protein
MRITVKFLAMAIVLSSVFFCGKVKYKEVTQAAYYTNTMLKLSGDSSFISIPDDYYSGGYVHFYKSIDLYLELCRDTQMSIVQAKCDRIPRIGESAFINSGLFCLYQDTPPSNPDTTNSMYVMYCKFAHPQYLYLTVPAQGFFEGIVPNDTLDTLYKKYWADWSLETKKGVRYLIADTLHDSLKGKIHIYTLYRYVEDIGIY